MPKPGDGKGQQNAQGLCWNQFSTLVAVDPSAKVELFVGPMQNPLFAQKIKSKDPAK